MPPHISLTPHEAQILVARVLDLFGVAVAAIGGALVGARRRLDWFGVMVVAVVTAIGGGTIRDVLLDRNPIFWIADQVYLVVIIISVIGTLAYTRRRSVPPRTLLVADAGALALFAISGSAIAEARHVPAMIVVLMGTITGCAGGMMRDVLCAQVPLILRRDVYATAAIVGSALYIVLGAVHAPSAIRVGGGMGAVFLLRMAAITWRWHLPAVALDQGDQSTP
jgi:uncharacterized membrane protein YeiH